MRKLNVEEWMPLNCVAGEDSWESLGLQGDQTNQSWINPEYSLEGLLLKLKLQTFGHLMQRIDSLEKTMMLGKIEGKRRRRQQRMRWLGSITDPKDISLSKLQEIVKDKEAWHYIVHGVTKSWTQLSNWTITQQQTNRYLYSFGMTLYTYKVTSNEHLIILHCFVRIEHMRLISKELWGWESRFYQACLCLQD